MRFKLFTHGLLVSLITTASFSTYTFGANERVRRPAKEDAAPAVAADEKCADDLEAVVASTTSTKRQASTVEKLMKGTSRTEKDVELILTLAEKLKATPVDDFKSNAVRDQWLEVVSGAVDKPGESPDLDQQRDLFAKIISASHIRARLNQEINVLNSTSLPADIVQMFDTAKRALSEGDVFKGEELSSKDREKLKRDPGVLTGLEAAVSFPHIVILVDTLRYLSDDSELRLWALKMILSKMKEQEIFLTHDEAFRLVRLMDEHDQVEAMRVLLANVMTPLNLYSQRVLRDEFSDLSPEAVALCKDNPNPQYESRAQLEKQAKQEKWLRNRFKYLIAGTVALSAIFVGSYEVLKPEPPKPVPVIVIPSRIEKIMTEAHTKTDATESADVLVDSVDKYVDNLRVGEVVQIVKDIKFQAQKDSAVDIFVHHRTDLRKIDLQTLQKLTSQQSDIYSYIQSLIDQMP